MLSDLHIQKNIISVFQDASDKFWAELVAQVQRHVADEPFMEQNHDPLAFLRGTLAGTQETWSTYEETFAIVKDFGRTEYILWGLNQVKIYTDHRNLLFVFAPLVLRVNSHGSCL